MSRKIIALEQLARFKENLDKVIKKLTVTVQTFDPMTSVPSFSSEQVREIIEARPDIIRVGVIGYSDYMFLFPSWTWDDDDTAPTHCEYIHMDVDSTFNVIYYAFAKNGSEYTCTASTKSLDEGGGSSTGATKGEFDISGNSDEWTQAQLEDAYTNKYDIVNVITSSNTTVLRKVSEYQGLGVLYWTFIPQQGIVINILTYDEQDGYAIQTQTRMPLVTMEVDGAAIMSEDQATLQEIYEKQPDILYVDAGNDGEQSYRKQAAKDDTISYSCFIPPVLADVKIIEDRNVEPHTYSISIERYDLSSLLVGN